jgi:hypothetical protein
MSRRRLILAGVLAATLPSLWPVSSRAAAGEKLKIVVVYSGPDSDMNKFGPRLHLSANVANWGVYDVHKVRQMLEGHAGHAALMNAPPCVSPHA